MAKWNQRTKIVIMVIGMISILGGAHFGGKLFRVIPAESVAGTSNPLRVAGAEEALNAELTNAAWHALNQREHDTAIELARRCINEFETEAEEIQRNLSKTKSSTSLTHQEIFSRGPLNDVAASYFIIGRASEELGDSKTAVAAYRKASSFTYAFVWDKRGWFWSPSEELVGGRRAPDFAEIFDSIP